MTSPKTVPKGAVGVVMELRIAKGCHVGMNIEARFVELIEAYPS